MKFILTLFIVFLVGFCISLTGTVSLISQGKDPDIVAIVTIVFFVVDITILAIFYSLAKEWDTFDEIFQFSKKETEVFLINLYDKKIEDDSGFIKKPVKTPEEWKKLNEIYRRKRLLSSAQEYISKIKTSENQ